MNHTPDCDGHWHPCFDCDDGFVIADCFEDSCPCADPDMSHDIVACETCNGSGGWLCPDAVAPAPAPASDVAERGR